MFLLVKYRLFCVAFVVRVVAVFGAMNVVIYGALVKKQLDLLRITILRHVRISICIINRKRTISTL